MRRPCGAKRRECGHLCERTDTHTSDRLAVRSIHLVSASLLFLSIPWIIVATTRSLSSPLFSPPLLSPLHFCIRNGLIRKEFRQTRVTFSSNEIHARLIVEIYEQSSTRSYHYESFYILYARRLTRIDSGVQVGVLSSISSNEVKNEYLEFQRHIIIV